MRDVLLGLGANRAGSWGAPAATLRLSLSGLAKVGVHPVAVSRLYRTVPVGGPAQAPFLNAVVLARTSLAPGSLLRAIKHLERAAGRRPRDRWGPRPLDIDIVDDGGRCIGWNRQPPRRMYIVPPGPGRTTPPEPPGTLILPHPRAHLRAFVLVPLLDIDPMWRHPALGRQARALLLALGPQRGGVAPAVEAWPETLPR